MASGVEVVVFFDHVLITTGMFVCPDPVHFCGTSPNIPTNTQVGTGDWSANSCRSILPIILTYAGTLGSSQFEVMQLGGVLCGI